MKLKSNLRKLVIIMSHYAECPTNLNWTLITEPACFNTFFVYFKISTILYNFSLHATYVQRRVFIFQVISQVLNRVTSLSNFKIRNIKISEGFPYSDCCYTLFLVARNSIF